MNTLEHRLRLAFDDTTHTQAALAKAARVKRPSVADWFNGKTRTLKAEPLVRASIYLRVRPLWLASGEGPMRDTALHTDEPQARYDTRPDWPFPLLPERTVCDLNALELARIETIVLVLAPTIAPALANRRAA